jgi:2-isopropylmalate synthase
VRVFVTYTDHEQTWDTVGVHENIVEASWEALIDAIEYYYNTVELPDAPVTDGNAAVATEVQR